MGRNGREGVLNLHIGSHTHVYKNRSISYKYLCIPDYYERSGVY